MNIIRFTNPKKRWEVVLRYFMYPIICILIIEITAMLSVLDHLTLKQIILYAMPKMLVYIVPSVISITFWYGGNRVMSIEYNYDTEILSLWHYNWLFYRREKHILLKDLRYRVFHIRAPFLLYRITLIQIEDKKYKRSLIFASGLGWERKQVDEIADKLKEIKKPIVYL